MTKIKKLALVLALIATSGLCFAASNTLTQPSLIIHNQTRSNNFHLHKFPDLRWPTGWTPASCATTAHYTISPHTWCYIKIKNLGKGLAIISEKTLKTVTGKLSLTWRGTTLPTCNVTTGMTCTVTIRDANTFVATITDTSKKP